MPPLYREQGVVLRTYKLGEADRIVVLMSATQGKVRAVAKGIRKTSSKFGARLNPTMHVALQLYEGRSLHTITQAEVLDGFANVRGDLDRLGRASVLLEAVDLVAQEGEMDVGLYKMLVGAMRALDRADSPMLVGAFLLKLLGNQGLAPMLDACAMCGAAPDNPAAPVDLVAFDIAVGGALCRNHRAGLPLSPAALDVCRRVFGGGLGSVLNEPPSPVCGEVETLAVRAFEATVERRLRSPHLYG